MAYQPFASAYNAVLEIAHTGGQPPASVTRSALGLSFRLPPEILELIGRIYRPDQIELHGVLRPQPPPAHANVEADNFDALFRVWANDGGLFLVLRHAC